MFWRILPWALWAALMVFSVATFHGLPSEIPQHFNSAGAVTDTAPATWFSWLMLPAIAGVVQIFLTWLTLLLPTQPELFNFPEKERFLKIPEAYRGDVIARMQLTLDVIATLTMVVLAGVQVLIWRAALGYSPKYLLPIGLIGTVLFIPLTLVLTSRVNHATEDAERKWKAATAGTDSKTSGPR